MGHGEIADVNFEGCKRERWKRSQLDKQQPCMCPDRNNILPKLPITSTRKESRLVAEGRPDIR